MKFDLKEVIRVSNVFAPFVLLILILITHMPDANLEKTIAYISALQITYVAVVWLFCFYLNRVQTLKKATLLDMGFSKEAVNGMTAIYLLCGIAVVCKGMILEGLGLMAASYFFYTANVFIVSVRMLVRTMDAKN